MRRFFTKLKEDTVALNYGREIIVDFSRQYLGHPTPPLRILDVGLGTATDILNVRNAFQPLQCELFGIDSYEPNIVGARNAGIHVASIDIERQRFPYPDRFLDLIIANQILEHTKELFWICSEFSRVLKPGGILIVGVPNLASLHNRILLLMGEQPSSIELLGPHVRGISKKSFVNFITADRYFDVVAVRGSNFYPFPSSVSAMLSKLFPAMSVSLFFCCRRTLKEGVFLDVLNTRFFETNFFKGEQDGR